MDHKTKQKHLKFIFEIHKYVVDVKAVQQTLENKYFSNGRCWMDYLVKTKPETK